MFVSIYFVCVFALGAETLSRQKRGGFRRLNSYLMLISKETKIKRDDDCQVLAAHSSCAAALGIVSPIFSFDLQQSRLLSFLHSLFFFCCLFNLV